MIESNRTDRKKGKETPVLWRPTSDPLRTGVSKNRNPTGAPLPPGTEQALMGSAARASPSPPGKKRLCQRVTVTGCKAARLHQRVGLGVGPAPSIPLLLQSAQA